MHAVPRRPGTRHSPCSLPRVAGMLREPGPALSASATRHLMRPHPQRVMSRCSPVHAGDRALRAALPRSARARAGARAAAGRAGPAPEKASTSEACSMSYRLECMSSHAVSMNLESAPGAARQRRRAGGGLRHRAQGAMSGWAPRAWREGQVPHGVVMAAQREQQLAGGHVEDGYRAVHRAARQPLPVGAVRHAQHKLLLFQLLLGLAAPPQPARWPGAQALSGRERGSSSLLTAGRTRAQRAPRAARAAP